MSLENWKCGHPKKFLVKLTQTGSVKKCSNCGIIIADSMEALKRWVYKK